MQTIYQSKKSASKAESLSSSPDPMTIDVMKPKISLDEVLSLQYFDWIRFTYVPIYSHDKRSVIKVR